MIIQVNGELREVDEALSLSNLIDQLELSPQRVAIELNKEVVRRSNWNSIVLRENDRVEIVHFVGGGCAFASTRESV